MLTDGPQINRCSIQLEVRAIYCQTAHTKGTGQSQNLRPRCICQGKVDIKKHHSFRSPVWSCTELGFCSPERPQVARNYSNEHTRQEALEHPYWSLDRSQGTILP